MPRNARDARESRGREGKRRSRAATNATQGNQRQAEGKQAEGKQAGASKQGRAAGGYLMPSRERAFWMAASVMLLPLSIWASSVMRSSVVSWRMVLVVPSAVSVFSTL